jgi:hypothetical protein
MGEVETFSSGFMQLISTFLTTPASQRLKSFAIIEEYW